MSDRLGGGMSGMIDVSNVLMRRSRTQRDAASNIEMDEGHPSTVRPFGVRSAQQIRGFDTLPVETNGPQTRWHPSRFI